MWRFLFNTGIATLAGVPAFWALKLSWTSQISADLRCAVRTYIQSVGSSSLVHFKMVCCLFSCRRIDFRRRLFWHKNGSKHAYRWLGWPFHGWNLILVPCPTNWNRSQNAVAPVKVGSRVKTVLFWRIPILGKCIFQHFKKETRFALIVLMFGTLISSGPNERPYGQEKEGGSVLRLKCMNTLQTGKCWRMLILVSRTTFLIQQRYCWTHAAFVGNHDGHKICQSQLHPLVARCLIVGV